MWRISSVAITVVPVYILLMFYFGLLLVDSSLSGTVLIFGPLSGGILYILARAVTLILAFTSLGDLPPGAYETVHWTTFILIFQFSLISSQARTTIHRCP